ncbi:MAG: hypothetical protein WDN72_04560 [Alphaproteobacteria bacterium]
MVATSRQYDFPAILDAFFSLKPLTGPHAGALRRIVEERASAILAHPDMRYMPTFKLLDLFAEYTNHAAAIDAEPQLRAPEATALLRNLLAEDSARNRQFLLDAALERARYEPMMLDADSGKAATRDALLRKRWQAMREVHQGLAALPADWLAAVEHTVELVIAAPNFRNYRAGPLMQYFAEMLHAARQLHAAGLPLDELTRVLGKQGPLWKRYALKSARFRVRNPSPFYFSQLPGAPTLH